MLKTKKQSSILVQYFIRNLSIAALSCAIVGLILFGFSIRQLNSVYEQEQLSSMQLAANDLSRQESLLHEISYDIRFDKVFFPDYFRLDPTYEIELVEQLENYQYVSPLIGDFFLLYHNTQDVYYPGHKTYFYIHMTSLGIRENPVTMYEKFTGVTGSQLVVSEDGRAFFCYRIPMRKQTGEGDAVLVFYLDPAILRERITTVMGFPIDDMSIYYQGVCIVGEDDGSAQKFLFQNGLYRAENCIASQSDDGRFILVTRSLKNASISLLESFRRASIMILVLFALIMLALAFYLAWRNYKPIQKLTSSYLPEGWKDKNELDQLSHLLSANAAFRQEERETLVRQMDELESQRIQIRRQFLLLLLGGNWDVASHETMDQGCLPLPLPCYGLLALRLGETEDEDQLCRMIEELSGEDMLFYATPLQDMHCLIVLVNLEEKAMLSVATDMLQNVLDASSVGYELLPGETCNQLSDLARMLVQLFTWNPAGAEMHSPQAMDEILEWIRLGDAEAAIPRLESMMMGMPQNYPSLLIRRNLYITIYSRLMELARKEGLNVEGITDGAALLTAKEYDLRIDLLRMARKICAQIDHKDDEPDDAKEIIHQKTMDYIDQHLLDYDLTLDGVSKAIGISSRQVSRILHHRTDMTYKEYVTSMRIERAKHFLIEENMSVAETSERVCYASVSYFIKTFRQYVGMTPANYKLLERVQTNENEIKEEDMP